MDVKSMENQYNCVIPEKRVKVWNIQIEMWKVLDQVCKENAIEYYFFWGALLGAVRHGGFIPWDDDIDVVMPREDYNRFAEIAPNHIKAPYFVLTPETVGNGLYCFTKLVDTRTTCLRDTYINPVTNHQGLCIDIVPLDGAPKSKYKRFLHYITMRLDCSLMNKRVSDFRHLSFMGKMLKILSVFYCMGKSQEECWRRLEKNRAIVSWDESEEVFESAHYTRFPKEFFGGGATTNIEFDGYNVPVPKEYDKILKILYNDYMRLPDVKNRMIADDEAAGWIIEPDVSYQDFSKIASEFKSKNLDYQKNAFHMYCDK